MFESLSVQHLWHGGFVHQNALLCTQGATEAGVSEPASCSWSNTFQPIVLMSVWIGACGQGFSRGAVMLALLLALLPPRAWQPCDNRV